MEAALSLVESSRVKVGPDEKTEPSPCTRTSAVRGRRFGSVTTPSSQTPSRVFRRTSNTGTPTGRGMAGHSPDSRRRSSGDLDSPLAPAPSSGDGRLSRRFQRSTALQGRAAPGPRDEPRRSADARALAPTPATRGGALRERLERAADPRPHRVDRVDLPALDRHRADAS